MAIYGNTISFGGGGQNDTLPPLLDNFKARKNTGNLIPVSNDTVLFSTLPSGTKVRMTSNNLYYATVTHSRTNNNDVALVYDTKEMGLAKKRNENDDNTSSMTADIFQWLNSAEKGNWWKSETTNPTPPQYSTDRGFLNLIGVNNKTIIEENFEEQQLTPPMESWKLFVVSYTGLMDYDFFEESFDYDVNGKDYLGSINTAGGWSTYNGRGRSDISTYVPEIGTGDLYDTQETYIHAVLKPKPTTKVKKNNDEYYFFEEESKITLSADKMQESRATDLAGAVWVYGDHLPKNVNDGTKINLTREEIVKPDIQSYSNPKTVEDLPSNSKVKLGRYGGKELQWIVCRNAEKKLFLVLEKDSVIALHGKTYDAPEPNNPDSNRKDYGNNNYPLSNIHQWLNSNKGNHEWYSKSHVYDAPPSYQSEKGFLKDWLPEELLIVLDTQWTTTKADVDGGGTESFTSKVTLMSTTEIGFETDTGGSKLDIFNSDKDRNIGEFYWTRNPYSLFPHGIGCVFGDGSVDFTPTNPTYYVRPICSVSETLSISDNPDSDGCYIFLATLPLERTVTWDKAKNFYARQFTYNPKKQYQTMLDGATASVMRPTMKVGDLPSKSTVKLGKFVFNDGETVFPLTWLTTKSKGKQYLILSPKSTTLPIMLMSFDAKEPNNPNSNRQTGGNNCYI